MIMEGQNKPLTSTSLLRRMERLLADRAQGNSRAAQELVYAAWETPDSNAAFDLLTRAVELEVTNIDAWLGLLDYTPTTVEERIPILRRLVALGEQKLGKRVFEQNKGHFWGLLETRPYMRARAQLAWNLMELDRFEESIAEYEAMLDLNPNDNQGMRYPLMACYLAIKRLDGARRLLEQYDELGFSALWAWAYVLERLLAGDPDGATQALQDARRQNRHAQAFFVEQRKVPRHLPGSYSPGSKEEAIIAWNILRRAWTRHPEAHAWLKAQCRK